MGAAAKTSARRCRSAKPQSQRRCRFRLPARDASGVRLSSAALPSAPAPAEEKPTSAPTGNISHGSSGLRSRRSRRPSCGRNEKTICQLAVLTRIAPRIALSRFCEPAFTRCFRNSDPRRTPGHSAQQHEAQNAPRHIARERSAPAPGSVSLRPKTSGRCQQRPARARRETAPGPAP